LSTPFSSRVNGWYFFTILSGDELLRVVNFRLSKPGEPGLASEELKKAANAYPVNAPLRYALALHHLTSGRKGDALEHAQVLAKIDDSYIIADSVQKGYILER